MRPQYWQHEPDGHQADTGIRDEVGDFPALVSRHALAWQGAPPMPYSDHQPVLLRDRKSLLGCGGRNETEEGALGTIGCIIPPPCRCQKVSVLGTRALASCAPTNHVDVEELRKIRLIWSWYNKVSDEQATRPHDRLARSKYLPALLVTPVM